ncbi:hypothetical protein NLJ89_g9527 [Agrocybe chaxingu]|uniref:Uncharacterized protein n=1 Tax=Agrocybe chaxingu TaxID=84603 RepID=A0A9W8JT41_9AGAR|nr:hypothetical protein NLJ89_g9527 [Agrocybe chaxingu]
MAPKAESQAKKTHDRDYKRLYYIANAESERQKARERARRRLETETAENAARRRRLHREAQARYRETNQVYLKTLAQKKRREQKSKIGQELGQSTDFREGGTHATE